MRMILFPVLLLVFTTGCNAQSNSKTDNNDTAGWQKASLA